MAGNRKTYQFTFSNDATGGEDDAHLALDDQVDENELAMRLDL